ncbi:hypothetical protein CN497_19445 [Priestia megaterium]|uniref:Uncharacterized protein n=1 Tax=Priestia megaterium TaxID=1404 RepID=A0AAE5P3P0_PRIMG|nr:hypothetical protein [Priestia megaterium]PES34783.1 hypothetical protein CN497_19445 [Priestia megaterium]
MKKIEDLTSIIHLDQVNAYNVEEVVDKYSILTVTFLLLFVEGNEPLRAAHFVGLENRGNL